MQRKSFIDLSNPDGPLRFISAPARYIVLPACPECGLAGTLFDNEFGVYGVCKNFRCMNHLHHYSCDLESDEDYIARLKRENTTPPYYLSITVIYENTIIGPLCVFCYSRQKDKLPGAILLQTDPLDKPTKCTECGFNWLEGAT